MGAFGPYSSASELLEAFREPVAPGSPYAPHVGTILSKTQWKAVDTIDLHVSEDVNHWTGRVDPKKNNWVGYVIPGAILTGVFNPNIYLKLMPSTEMTPALQQKMAHASSREEIEAVAKQAMAEGTPPKKFRLYLTGPHPDAFEQLIEEGEKIANDQATAKGGGPNLQRALSEIKPFAKKLRDEEEVVLGWIEYSIEIVGDAYTSSKFEISSVAKQVARWSGGRIVNGTATPDHVTPSELRKLNTGIGPSNRVEHVAVVLFNYYMARVWKHFLKYENSQASAITSLKQGLHSARADYDQSKAKEEPAKEEPESGLSFVFHPPKPKKGESSAAGTLVVPSVQSDGGDPPFDVVSADPDDRFLITDYFGTYKRKNPPRDQRDLSFVPASGVRSILSNDSYFAQVGLFMENPLVSPNRNKQVWWYSNRNQFLASARRFSLFTGDKAHIALLIFDKRKHRTRVSLAQLAKRRDDDAQDFFRQVQELKRVFDHQAEQGKRYFRQRLQTNFGVDLSKLPEVEQNLPEKIKGMKNPYREAKPPLGFPSEEAWNDFIRKTRSDITTKMGLAIDAAAPAEYMYSRHQINSRLKKTAHTEYSGKMAGNKPVEPWGLYLIQYILAHSPSETTASYTHMIPINIIRSQKAEIPPMSYDKVRPHHLKEWMQEYLGKYRYFATTTDWVYIPAHPTRGFPYARMIRPTILTDPNVMAHINAKLPEGVTVTPRGYKFDGVEYDAFTMLVAMPPSAVEEKFGLMRRDQVARQLISDPTMINRLRRGKASIRSGTLGDLDLFSAPMTFVGAGTYHPDDKGKAAVSLRTRESLSDFDPTKRGAIPEKTELTPEFFTNALGETWRPKIESYLRGVGGAVRAKLTEYEHVNTPEQRAAKVDEIMTNLGTEAKEAEILINGYLRYLTSISNAYKNKTQDEISKNIQTYVSFVKTEVDNSGRTIQLPHIMKYLPLKEYQAPFGSIRYKSLVMSIKAPSPDVAKLLIVYRLLRRSVRNKAVGKLMATRAFGQRARLFPDQHAILLAQWAAAGFPVVEQESTHTGYIPSAKKYSPKDYEMIRASRYGEHITARMMRLDGE